MPDQPSSLSKRYPLAWPIAWTYMTFFILFPKGGIKFGFVPLTWGYVAFGLTVPVLAVIRLVQLPLRFPMAALLNTAALVPFWILLGFSMLANGIYNPNYTLSTVICLVLMPPIFLLIFPPFLNYLDGPKFRRHFCFCVHATVLWGILLFFWHPIFQHFIEVPYLTVNAEDFGQLELTKHIARGLFLKNISTYNNGNLYGVCMLILSPLYACLQTSTWKRWLLPIALVLTLSRTVWAGVVVTELLL